MEFYNGHLISLTTFSHALGMIQTRPMVRTIEQSADTRVILRALRDSQLRVNANTLQCLPVISRAVFLGCGV